MKRVAKLVGHSVAREYTVEHAVRMAHNKWLRSDAPWYWRLFTNAGFLFDTMLRFKWAEECNSVLRDNYFGLVVDDDGVPYGDGPGGSYLSRESALSLLGIVEIEEEK